MNDTCGCCAGIEEVTPAPLANRPGLSAIAYRAGTHARFLETMLSQLASKAIAAPNGQTTYPLRALTTLEPNDPSIALLDAWATVADVLTFYQERIANEGYLRTATERRSIVELGRLVGYAPRPGVAASAYVAYGLDAGAQATIKTGSKVQSVPGPGEFPQTFETSEDLEARGEWNTLNVRKTRTTAAADFAAPAADTSQPLYFKGITTGLRPNDPLLVDFGTHQIVYRVLEVAPDSVADRTRVDIRPWQRTSTQPLLPARAPQSASAFLARSTPNAVVVALLGLVERYSNLESFNVPRTSVIAGRAADLLERLQTNLMLGLRGHELRDFLAAEVLPELREEREKAAHTTSAPLKAWINRLVSEVEELDESADELNALVAFEDVAATPAAIAGNGTITHGRAAVLPRRAARIQGSTSIGSALSDLAKPPSVPPPNSLRLARSPEATFGARSDTLPGLLATLRPDIAPVLYKAWRNVPATPASTLRIYALRTRASAFGSNAPPEQIKNRDGVVVGTREWTLFKESGDQVPELFEVTVLLTWPNDSGGLRDASISKVAIRIKDAVLSVPPPPLGSGVGTVTIDFPAADEQVVITLTQPSDSPPTPGVLRVVFSRRKMIFETTLDISRRLDDGEEGGPLLTWSSEGSDPTSVRYSTGFISASGGGGGGVVITADEIDSSLEALRVTISGTRSIPAGTVPTEQPDVISLDATYPAIAPESWIVLERPELASSPPAQRLIVSRVVGVRDAARADYGITGKSTFVQLDQPWLNISRAGDSFGVIRGTAVYAQSEPLELAPAPIDPVADPICGGEIELDQLYDGLKPGRWLIVAGERTDVAGESEGGTGDGSPPRTASPPNGSPPNGDPGSVPLAGVPATELVMLAGVRQEYDSTEEGARTRTILSLSTGLAYCYRRDTLLVYGNVVKATHGETRSEVLGSGDGGKPNQSFDLKQKPLTYVSAITPSGVASTLKVYVDGVQWSEADGLAGLTPTDRRFITKTADDDTTSAIFGNGRAGARLPTGQENVTAIYRYGIGKPGNVKAGQLSLLGTRPQGVMSVINPLPASGGADREGPEQARRNIPLVATSLDRIVAEQDYADFARTFAGIGKASATRLADGRRELVHLTIAGEDDIPIDTSSDLYQNLRRALSQFGDPFQPFQVDVRRLRLLVIVAKVLLDPTYLWENVATAIREKLLGRFSFANRQLGQGVDQSEVFGAIQAVGGVVAVDIDILDTIDEDQITQQLTEPTKDGLAGSLTLRAHISARPAMVVAEPSPHINAAELIFLSPDAPDTLILSEKKA
jgi:hypothetical protein